MSYDASNHMIKDDYPDSNQDGVSVYDVQLALGNGTAISENRVGALCSDLDSNGNTITRINKWARYKPERVNGKYHRITHDIRKQNHFSLDVPYCYWPYKWKEYSLSGMVCDIVYRDNNDSDKYNGWEYLRPRGDISNSQQNNGVVEMYRLADFLRVYNDSSDSTSSSLTGYQHNAEMPFTCSINEQDANKKVVTIQEPYKLPNFTVDVLCYEFNQNDADIVITIHNSSGNNLHLQDFINLSDNSGTVVWRPVLQVYNNDKLADEDYWWDKSAPDLQVVGDPITTNDDDIEITLPIDNFPNAANTYYHLCVGIGCVNDKNTEGGSWIWKSGDNALFLPPYSSTHESSGKYPFYYVFSVSNHTTRDLLFTHIAWGTGTNDHKAPDTVGTNFFTVPSSASGLLYLTFEVSKSNQKAYFSNENNTIPIDGYKPSNAVPLRIKLTKGGTDYYLTPGKESIKQGVSLGYASPVTPGQDTYAQYAVIDAASSSTSEVVTLYAISDIYLQNLSAGTNTFRVYTTTSSGDDNWTDFGVLEIYKS